MGTLLDTIVAAHRAAAAADDRDLDTLVAAAGSTPPPRPFASALVGDDGLAVIAEVKRRSPSRGDLALDLDPTALCRAYHAGGAACVSVLTDGEFFGGAPADLAAAREACPLPVLRKDFTVDERDVADARLMGADAVLLIAAVLDDRLLGRCIALAAGLGLGALVEVHDEVEIDRAAAAGAGVIGVNQRDLRTFAVDGGLAERLAPRLPPEAVWVAESGVGGQADAKGLAAAGYDAVLVGEALLTSADPAAAVGALRAVGG
ncbi:MAG: indole-3-glycerol phosphate synthase TrpC [Acidimicrobiales bacterium]